MRRGRRKTVCARGAYQALLAGRSTSPLERMTPRQLVQAWVEAFNRADVDALASFYTTDAVNHQVAETPVQGRENIRQMFASGFASAPMVCIVENLFEDGEWAILEWRDPKGLRGYVLLHVALGRIVFQRGYWDSPTLLRRQALPLPRELPAGTHAVFAAFAPRRDRVR